MSLVPVKPCVSVRIWIALIFFMTVLAKKPDVLEYRVVKSELYSPISVPPVTTLVFTAKTPTQIPCTTVAFQGGAQLDHNVDRFSAKPSLQFNDPRVGCGSPKLAFR